MLHRCLEAGRQVIWPIGFQAFLTAQRCSGIRGDTNPHPTPRALPWVLTEHWWSRLRLLLSLLLVSMGFLILRMGVHSAGGPDLAVT